MTPEDFSYFRSRVSRFVSGSSSGIKFGSSVTPRYTKLSSIIPRRTLPQQVLERLQKKTTSDVDDNIDTSPRGISALGRVTLNLEQTKNNLEKILQIIADDYKNSKEQNRKEVDEYRKRIANRGRIFGKRELGDRKSDVLGTVKKYVGSFFSGTGGAIRSLAMFNLLQGLLSGDPSKIIGPLLGIGLTYIPSIIGNVIGGVIGSVGTSLVGRMFGGGARTAAPAAGAAAGASRMGSLARFGGKAALLGGGIALASNMFNRPQEDGTQQRLEQLTEQQKGSTATLVPLPQDELKRFDNLNKKFEEALDFLLKKQKENVGGQKGAGGVSPPPPPTPGPSGVTIQDDAQALSELGITQEQFNAYKQGVSDIEGAAYNQMGGAGKRFAGRYQMGSGEIASAAAVMGIPNPTQQEFLSNPELQEKIYMGRTVLMNRRMMQLSPEYRSMSVAERLPVLAGAQLGEGNLTDYLKGKSVADSAGVEIQRWINSVKSRLSQVGGGAFSPSLRRASPRPPVAATPNVTVLPVPVNAGSQQQTSAASPGNSIVPPIDTTYPENFLALYSKLIYQIV